MTQYVVGIDPGLKGGIAILSDTDSPAVIPMPVAGKEIDVHYIKGWLGGLAGFPVYVWIEKVHSMPQQGVASTFNFAMNYGVVIGAVQSLGYPLQLVAPQTWKKVILKDTDRSKAAAIAYVLRRFPDVNLYETPRSRTLHDGMAESVCIAEYGLLQLQKEQG